MIIVDLKSKLLPFSHKIWALHAGTGRQYFDIFKKEDAVFLELPGFRASDETFSDRALIRRHLRMADAVQDYIRRAANDGVAPPSPSTEPSDYSLRAGDRSFNARAGNVEALYREARPGDLLAIPGGRGQYGSVHFAEIASPFDHQDTVDFGFFAGFPIPVRKIRWLGRATQKRHLSELLSKRLENRHAIIRIQRHLFEAEVYGHAYANYATSSQSKADFFGPSYTSEDAFDIFPAARLIRFLVAASIAVESGNAADLERHSVDNIIERFYDRHLIADFKIDFSSPGRFTIISKRNTLAIIVASGVAVAVASLPQQLVRQLDVVNSEAHAADEDPEEYKERFKQLMNSLGKSQYEEMLQAGRDAKKAIGLQSGSAVMPQQDFQ